MLLLATNHNLVTRDQVRRPSYYLYTVVSPVKNPKVQNLVNEILKDSAIVEDNTVESRYLKLSGDRAKRSRQREFEIANLLEISNLFKN